MNDVEKLRFLEKTWKRAADDALENILRLTATPPGGRKAGEKIEVYVKRVRSMQDVELEKYNYALCELLKVGKRYEEYI